MARRRVVVTGLGMVSALGGGVCASWSGLLAGKCGVRSTLALGAAYAALSCRVAAWISSTELTGFLQRERDARPLPRFIQYALMASQEALDDSKVDPERLGDDAVRKLGKHALTKRQGVCIGAGMAPLDKIADVQQVYAEKGPRRVDPHFIPRILPNMAAGHVSIRHGLRGPLMAPATACATGAHAIGDAFRLIQHGYAETMLAGGTEAAVCPLAVAGFSQARALCTRYNDDPAKSSRPFDRSRDGFVIGEGAGVMVLEERDRAIDRGARIYAEVCGYGCSADAHHITASHPEGLGAKSAMHRALLDAEVSPAQIGYINAHATSTPLGDLAEARAIMQLFSNPPGLLVSSNKGAIGHLLGAAGAVEAIFTVLSLYHSAVPPTLNYEEIEEPGCRLDFVAEGGREAKHLRYALSNSFGFGGTNASLCFRRAGTPSH